MVCAPASPLPSVIQQPFFGRAADRAGALRSLSSYLPASAITALAVSTGPAAEMAHQTLPVPGLATGAAAVG